MIDTFSRPKSREKKMRTGIIIIFLRRTNDPCNSRNFNFGQLSANRQRPPSTADHCAYHPTVYEQSGPL